MHNCKTNLEPCMGLINKRGDEGRKKRANIKNKNSTGD